MRRMRKSKECSYSLPNSRIIVRGGVTVLIYKVECYTWPATYFVCVR
jgi:hypothetical protein